MEPRDVISILAIAAVVVIIMVKQLLAHQRQMTAILQKNGMQQQLPNPETLQMRQDMQELKQLVHQQAITIDNLSNKIDGMASNNEVQRRLEVAQ